MGTWFGRQQRVGLVKLPDVVGAIIWRQGDAAQHHFGSRMQERGHDLIEILPGRSNGEATQAIVPAEGHDHQDRLQAQRVLQSIHPVLGGVSADALVDYLVVIALRVQILFQVVGIALARVGAVPRSEAVAESDDHGPPVYWSTAGGGRIRCSRGRLGNRRFRSFGPATGKQETGKQNAGESSVSHKLTVEHFPACVRIPNPGDRAVND